MGSFSGTFIKLVLLSLSLLSVLLHSTPVSASLLFKHEKACGKYRISHEGDPSRAHFYVDGKSVDRYIFCDVLRDHPARICFAPEIVRNHYCTLALDLDKLPLQAGRKYLELVENEGYHRYNYDNNPFQERQDKSATNSLLKPKMLALAVPGLFILSCALLCPCFQARRRDSGRTVLSREPDSRDTISSLETNPIFEKFPRSPLRVPPSPLRVPPSPSRFSPSPKFNRLGCVHLNMRQVARATHNFSPSLVIGEGGFGTVYKAELPDGQVVAIKRAREGQFDALSSEFKNEVELLAKIDHRNLVKLLGYVEKGNERMIITEYVSNGTLREHLDGLKGKILNFNQRLEISIDIAHGLTYLHLYAEKQIIHRDIKSSNILLTDNLRAKVADFGFARVGEDSDNTHVLTKVRGTVGYLDLEYMKTHKLTSKSDVYSFGIVLLEILTGRRPVELKAPDERVTVRWAFTKYNEGKFAEMLDPLMNEFVDEGILEKIFGLAIQCAAPTRADRPNMKTVGERLWSIRMDYRRTEGKQ